MKPERSLKMDGINHKHNSLYRYSISVTRQIGKQNDTSNQYNLLLIKHVVFKMKWFEERQNQTDLKFNIKKHMNG